jgi:hypothetical protein
MAPPNRVGSCKETTERIAVRERGAAFFQVKYIRLENLVPKGQTHARPRRVQMPVSRRGRAGTEGLEHESDYVEVILLRLGCRWAEFSLVFDGVSIFHHSIEPLRMAGRVWIRDDNLTCCVESNCA